MIRSTILTALLAASVCAAAPPIKPCTTCPAPLLFVHLSGPAGGAVTFLEGSGFEKTYATPVTVGFRPGHAYRMKLEGPDLVGGVALYPSIEVRGTLFLPPKSSAAEYPAPITITESDIESALVGQFITKIITVENAEEATAVDLSTSELDVPPKRDPVKYAEHFGRPIMIVRLGPREPELDELANLPTNCILYPGETVLPPLGHASGYPIYSHCSPPLRGGRSHNRDGVADYKLSDLSVECLRDGGDRKAPIHIGPGGRLHGLDPSDSAAEYRDSKGRRRVTTSNEVCLCVPRFLTFRHGLSPTAFDSTRGSSTVDGQQPGAPISAVQGSRTNRQTEDAPTLRNLQKLNENVVVLTQQGFTGMAPVLRGFGQVRGVGRIAGSEQSKQTIHVNCECCSTSPGQPLELCKWASRQSAKIGDKVTFYIRYCNLWEESIEDLAVSDSLAGRLEYVPGSARSDREAVFVTQPNENGSLVLRWEILTPLKPGHKGIVSFKAVIR